MRCLLLFMCLISHVLDAHAQSAPDVRIEVKYHKEMGPTNRLMIKSGIKTLAMEPVRIIKSVSKEVAGLSYNKLIENTRKAKQKHDLQNSCVATPEVNENFNDLSSILEGLNVCECSAWNSCPGKECSESEVCPFDLSIFKITAHQNLPKKGNQLPFRNHDKSMPYLEVTGFCWGMATTTQRLNALSVFEPHQKAPFSEGTKEWVNFYKEKIESMIINNQARAIPGFSSIHQLSSHPSFKDYFKEMVAKVWARQGMNLRAIGDTAKKMTPSHMKSFSEELGELLNYGVSPVIVRAGGLSDVGSSHVIIPWKKIDQGEKSTFCINDNNLFSGENLACAHSFNTSQNSEDDKAFNFSYHYRSDLLEQAKSLHKMCKDRFKQGNLPSLPKNDDKDFPQLLEGMPEEEIEKIFLQAFNKELGEESNGYLSAVGKLKHKFRPAFIKKHFGSFQEFLKKLGDRVTDLGEDEKDLTPFSHGLKIEADITKELFESAIKNKSLDSLRFLNNIEGDDCDLLFQIVRENKKYDSKALQNLTENTTLTAIPEKFWKKIESDLLGANGHLENANLEFYSTSIANFMVDEKLYKFSPEFQRALIDNIGVKVLPVYAEQILTSLESTKSNIDPEVKFLLERAVKHPNKE